MPTNYSILRLPQISIMLALHSTIVEELQKEDGLLILAKGLGIDIIINEYISKLSYEGQYLVFILNHSNPAITNDINIKNRCKIYQSGGVCSITSRILITDLINNVIDFKLIKCVLVLEADKVTESSTEHFILKLIHQHTTPSIKGFSQNPEKFVFGFNKIERMLSSLYLQNLFLYPRYRDAVNDGLKKLFIEEHSIPVQKDLLDIEHCIRDCLQIVISDLKSSCRWIDPTEITLEKSLTSNFEFLLKQELEPNDYKLSDSSQLAIEEIKFFKHLLSYLYDYDCISFLKYFESHVNAMTVKASWTTHFCATQIHSKAKDRVYIKRLGPSIHYKHNNITYKLPLNVAPVLKENCKWACISNILTDQKTLILTDSTSTTIYLRKYLTQPNVVIGDKSINLLMLFKLGYYFKERGELEKNKIVSQSHPVAEKARTNKRRRLRGTNLMSNSVGSQIVHEGIEMDLIELEEGRENLNAVIENVNDLKTIEQLSIIKPQQIILYHPSLYALRLVEVYCTLNENITIHVLTIKESQEEQQCLMDVRREKDAFHKLIIDQERLAVPIQAMHLLDQNATTRIAGGQSKERCVIVDVREFRSRLPLSLFNRNFKLSAVTLNVGDYILAPNMAVERKVVSDLISSLNSGRLYYQAQQLCLNYEFPILLIEFTESRSLRVQYLMKYNALGKVTVLMHYFPKLQIYMSPDTEFSAKLFELLKINKQEPEVDTAKNVGNESDVASGADFVQSMPGVNSFNYKKLIKEYQTVLQILGASKTKLRTILGKQNGDELYDFINKEF
eukprot:NODE_363_length_10100_cov_0.133787.p2 type:complete len:788 gc:universal NODE_363_length_10100_cov_0.133787:10022-7659(-)